MSNFLTITLKGAEKVAKYLVQQQEKQIASMEKAHTKVATEAVRQLKRGLSHYGGSGKNQVASPKGSMPFLHTGQLRESIGFKVARRGKKVTSEVGSGAQVRAAPYAKYLEGYNNDGIRPFLWAVQELYTPERIIAYFNEYYAKAKSK